VKTNSETGEEHDRAMGPGACLSDIIDINLSMRKLLTNSETGR